MRPGAGSRRELGDILGYIFREKNILRLNQRCFMHPASNVVSYTLTEEKIAMALRL